MRYKAVLFDLDGTLINSIFDLHASVNYILKKYGYKEITEKQAYSYVGNGLKVLLTLSLGKKDSSEISNFDEMFKELKEYYFSHCCEKTIPYDGIKELLTKLKSEGYKLAVVTNKPDFAAKEICDKFFGSLLDIVIGEKEGTARKPAPDMSEKAMAFLGVKKSETLYVGDSEVDILTGKNTGIDVLSVSYGFRSKNDIIKAGAEIIVDNPVEIYVFLNK